MHPLQELVSFGPRSGWGQIALTSVAALLSVALFFYACMRMGRSGLLLLRRYQQPGLPPRLQRYRDRLEEATFRVHHAWMKEDQVLDDILVPMHIDPQGEAAPTDWESFDARALLGRLLRARQPGAVAPRAILLGAPGAGKSVALRIVARSAWSLAAAGAPPPHLPVLFSFSDLVRHGLNLAAAAAESLRVRGFGEGEPNPDAACRGFVDAALPRGELLLLVDGLDELRRDDRIAAVDAVVKLAEEHRATPIVLACRSIPYREHHHRLATIRVEEIEVAKFSQAAVRGFVRRWRFDAPKNAAELIATIEGNPHLQDLVENPLMLTIVTFLYALPKYRLPDSRAQFYEVCCRALLEEWDQAKAPTRANRFERPHKEELLARLAHAHLTGTDPEADIAEKFARDRFAEWLHGMGLARAEAGTALKEITENSGLLVHFPPEGLRFPHQTFLEYFAAHYFLHWGRSGGPLREARDALVVAFPTQGELAQFVSFSWGENLEAIAGQGPLAEVAFKLLEWARARGRLVELMELAAKERPGNTALGAVAGALRGALQRAQGGEATKAVEDIAAMGADPRRTREVLVLFCGLTMDRDAVGHAIRRALQAKDVELALELVSNARQLDVGAAEAALVEASAALRSMPTPALVELFGQLARNRLSAFAEQARAALVGLADQDIGGLSEPVLEALVLALTRTSDAADLQRIVDNFHRLRLPVLLPRMGERAIAVLAALIETDRLPPEQMAEWIESLRAAGMVTLLYRTMVGARDAKARQRAAIALAQLSEQAGYYQTLDDPDLPPVPDTIAHRKVMKEWGWPRPVPATERGRERAVAISSAVTEALIEGVWPETQAMGSSLHPWMAYLAFARWRERMPLRLGEDEYIRRELCTLSVTRPGRAQQIWRSSEADPSFISPWPKGMSEVLVRTQFLWFFALYMCAHAIKHEQLPGQNRHTSKIFISCFIGIFALSACLTLARQRRERIRNKAELLLAMFFPLFFGVFGTTNSMTKPHWRQDRMRVYEFIWGMTLHALLILVAANSESLQFLAIVAIPASAWLFLGAWATDLLPIRWHTDSLRNLLYTAKWTPPKSSP